ncbi:MAG TPA: hypothetical protein VII31_06305, partial [Caldimonas sp.]
MSTRASKDDDDDAHADLPARLELALKAAPQDASMHRAMAQVKRAQGDELGALAHLIAAQTLEAHAAG